MSDKLLSDLKRVELFHASLNGTAAAIEVALKSAPGETNLQVMDQLNAVCEKLESCNSNFKALLVQNADSFLDIQEVFADFDATMARTKEVN